jgi:uncharacterized metal-binding protein (TIGR02443 family)
LSRFIAGAICPKCKELDRIVVKEMNNILIRQCVSCGFAEDKPEDAQTPSLSLKGRLELPLFNEVETKKLTIIKPTKKIKPG